MFANYFGNWFANWFGDSEDEQPSKESGGGNILYPLDELTVMGIQQKNRQQNTMDIVKLAFGSGVVR